MNEQQHEQTLVLIKPDALKNSTTGFIFSQLSEFHTGARFAAAKVVHVSRFLAAEHYAEHYGKPFYASLLEYLTGSIHYDEQNKWKRRVIAIVFHGVGVLQTLRSIAGPTNPHNARDEKPGCIRSLGTVVPIEDEAGNVVSSRMDNLIHTSASREEAEREIKLWFLPHDIPPFMRAYPIETCSGHYYYKEGRLFDTYEQDSRLLLAPGDLVWKTDLEVLQNCTENEPGEGKLNAVVAKYLINRS